MNKKTAGILCTLLACTAIFILNYNIHNWLYILIGALFAVVAIVIALFVIVFNDKSLKRTSYVIIACMAILFLAYGLYGK
jgi:cytochrome bd-type quinol oxidase subunit 2